MRGWFAVLGGLAVWAAHFAALYAIASAFPGQAVARWLILPATLGAIAADGFILWRLGRSSSPDPLDRWLCRLGRLGVAVSLVAIVWQSAPAALAMPDVPQSIAAGAVEAAPR